MEFNPLVSVIIPNYNHAQFLDIRIQSVLDQTYPNFEVIILDDKSTDDSLKIIDKYKENPHVSRILVNTENSGSPFIQWDTRLHLPKGHYIWIAESDDYCEKSFLIKLVDLCVRNGLAYAFCRSKTIGMNNEEIPNHWQQGLKESFVMRGSDFIEKYMVYSCVVLNASSAIFSKEMALEISTEYQTYRGAGDWLFWTGIASQGNVGVLARPLNYYRVHDKKLNSIQ